jgi:hypothetical protein
MSDNATGVRDVLVLRSDRFSLECPIENGLQYDCPLGDDLAAYLKEAIQRGDPTWRLLDPIREDYGTELLCYRGRRCFRITINWVPLGTRRDDGEDLWVVHFSQSHGCLSWLLRARDDVTSLSSLRALIGDVVRSDRAVFRSTEWLTETELIAIERSYSGRKQG